MHIESAGDFLLHCHLRTNAPPEIDYHHQNYYFFVVLSLKKVIKFGFPTRDFFSKQKTSTYMRVYFIFRARMLSVLLLKKKNY